MKLIDALIALGALAALTIVILSSAESATHYIDMFCSRIFSL